MPWLNGAGFPKRGGAKTEEESGAIPGANSGTEKAAGVEGGSELWKAGWAWSGTSSGGIEVMDSSNRPCRSASKSKELDKMGEAAVGTG